MRWEEDTERQVGNEDVAVCSWRAVFGACGVRSMWKLGDWKQNRAWIGWSGRWQGVGEASEKRV